MMTKKHLTSKTSTKTNSPLIAAAKSGGLQKIIEQALELFEDESEAESWLFSPQEALDGQKPIDIISTDEGLKKVEELLYRAAYGVFS